MAKGPNLPDITSLIQAGIDPRTRLPLKMVGGDPEVLKNNIRKTLRIKDEQIAINRYKWYNLPDSLDGELLERILYYRGQGAFFYMETDNSFYFLPYALNGTIDVYGRFTGITPLPFNGTSTDGKDKPWIVGLTRKPVYSIKYNELTMKDLTDSCVLLHDYSRQISQNVQPRQALMDPILEVEAEMIPFMRTSCLLGTGVKGMRVNDADQESSVEIASKQVEKAALSGKPWIPIVSNIEFQEISDPANLKGADYMQALQSLDNFRLSLYGLETGGVFEKKAHMLQSEQNSNSGGSQLVYEDGLRIRQQFCNIVNSIWNLGIWCDMPESVAGMDTNGDMMAYDNEESQGIDSSVDEGGNENDTDV